MRREDKHGNVKTEESMDCVKNTFKMGVNSDMTTDSNVWKNSIYCAEYL